MKLLLLTELTQAFDYSSDIIPGLRVSEIIAFNDVKSLSGMYPLIQNRNSALSGTA